MTLPHRLAALALACGALVLNSIPAAAGETASAAQTDPDIKLPPGFRYEALVQGDIPEPVYLQFCPDGRLWFTGRRGQVWAYDFETKKHDLIATIPTDWHPVQGREANERGLHGIEFHPDYLKNGEVYLYYAPEYGGQVYSNRVSRFVVDNPKRATGLKAGSEKMLMEWVSLRGFHQGGAMEYNPKDGKLYVTMGDNNVSKDTESFWNDPKNPPQVLGMYQGKTLRINLDGSIPSDNPFVKTAGAAPQVYTYGHRNPYSLHIDETDGRVYVGEVGYDRQEDWEEINLLKAGGNYGWPFYMGNNLPVFATTETNRYPDAIKPWLTYGHVGGANATVGPIYHAKGKGAFPEQYQGGMFYADFTRKTVRFAEVDPATHAVVKTTAFGRGFKAGALQMQLGQDGAVYLAEYGGWFTGSPKDAISRIVYVGEGKE